MRPSISARRGLLKLTLREAFVLEQTMDYEVQVSWIKLLTGTFEDEKIKLILTMPDGYEIFTIWIRLLVQAGKTNDNGRIYLTQDIPYTDETLASILHHSIEMIHSALDTLKKFGMIKFNNGIMQIVNWSKHQNVGGLEKIKEQNRERQKRYRKTHQEVPAPDKPAKKPDESGPDSQDKTTEYYDIFFAKTQKSGKRVPKKVAPMLRNTISKAVKVLTQTQYESVLNRCIKLKGTDQSWEYYLDSIWREAGKIESLNHKKETPAIGAILTKMAKKEKQ